MNDSTVSVTSINKVLSQQAYILFYGRDSADTLPDGLSNPSPLPPPLPSLPSLPPPAARNSSDDRHDRPQAKTAAKLDSKRTTKQIVIISVFDIYNITF